jgi:hypothetical protein
LNSRLLQFSLPFLVGVSICAGQQSAPASPQPRVLHAVTAHPDEAFMGSIFVRYAREGLGQQFATIQ